MQQIPKNWSFGSCECGELYLGPLQKHCSASSSSLCPAFYVVLGKNSVPLALFFQYIFKDPLSHLSSPPSCFYSNIVPNLSRSNYLYIQDKNRSRKYTANIRQMSPLLLSLQHFLLKFPYSDKLNQHIEHIYVQISCKKRQG